MKAISFELSGKTAFFKKPDVNVYSYFTYNNIHKPALLGILGAILGLKGHNQLFNEIQILELKYKNNKKDIELKEKLEKLKNSYPEYYEKLSNLKISIVPLAENGYFTKKIQVFNNSVGYASKEQGGNLIVREQWLESPIWKIIILDDNSIEREVFDKLEDYLLNSKAVFIPYLGKNDHPAKIDNVEIVELDEIENYKKIEKYIDSLFSKDGLNDNFNGFEKEGEFPFFFQEVSPIKLKEKYHFYEYESLVFTNLELIEFPKNTFRIGNKNYVFI